MKAVVDRDLCIGCGICEQMCPEVFRMAEDGLAYVIDEAPPPDAYADVQSCVEMCPVAAISVEAD
ncbi:MAG: ferredoxin [Aeromicrobium sp.]|jgi:ferredoxin|nr:ferredoxin [Aeromicrobium sp.]